MVRLFWMSLLVFVVLVGLDGKVVWAERVKLGSAADSNDLSAKSVTVLGKKALSENQSCAEPLQGTVAKGPDARLRRVNAEASSLEAAQANEAGLIGPGTPPRSRSARVIAAAEKTPQMGVLQQSFQIKRPTRGMVEGGKAVNKRGNVKQKLTPMQYKVTQENGTEPAFRNEYWDNHREGIYVDVVSGKPLFSSKDKFDSGTGWPSFTQPIAKGDVVEKKDESSFMARTEVRSADSDAHLGHVFNDGPAPAGTRFCINSAALRFIPKEDLEKEGYREYKKLFEK